jgi:hypothetical protein
MSFCYEKENSDFYVVQKVPYMELWKLTGGEYA